MPDFPGIAADDLRGTYEMPVLRPDPHIAWRGQTMPPDPHALAALVTGR